FFACRFEDFCMHMSIFICAMTQTDRIELITKEVAGIKSLITTYITAQCSRVKQLIKLLPSDHHTRAASFFIPQLRVVITFLQIVWEALETVQLDFVRPAHEAVWDQSVLSDTGKIVVAAKNITESMLRTNQDSAEVDDVTSDAEADRYKKIYAAQV